MVLRASPTANKTAPITTASTSDHARLRQTLQRPIGPVRGLRRSSPDSRRFSLSTLKSHSSLVTRHFHFFLLRRVFVSSSSFFFFSSSSGSSRSLRPPSSCSAIDFNFAATRACTLSPGEFAALAAPPGLHARQQFQAFVDRLHRPDVELPCAAGGDHILAQHQVLARCSPGSSRPARPSSRAPGTCRSNPSILYCTPPTGCTRPC